MRLLVAWLISVLVSARAGSWVLFPLSYLVIDLLWTLFLLEDLLFVDLSLFNHLDVCFDL